MVEEATTRMPNDLVRVGVVEFVLCQGKLRTDHYRTATGQISEKEKAQKKCRGLDYVADTGGSNNKKSFSWQKYSLEKLWQDRRPAASVLSECQIQLEGGYCRGIGFHGGDPSVKRDKKIEDRFIRYRFAVECAKFGVDWIGQQ